MDKSKRAAFVRAKKSKGQKSSFSKGGMVKRIGNLKYFDNGGTVNNHGLVGTVGNLLGQNNQFSGQTTDIVRGTNEQQLGAAYNGAQSGINQQQNLANSLAAQGDQGRGTQLDLTGQLQGVVNGTGPNPAQAALNQNTGNNVAQQAALMAGQRGASANAGLIARQAAQQGAAVQQNAVGQAATLQAQQQIAAQQELQNLAQTQIAQQANAVQGVNNVQQNEQSILQNANTAANNANVAMQSNINNVNAGVAAGNQQQAGNILGGIGGALSHVPVIGSLFAHGGEVPHLANGGPLAVAAAGPVQQNAAPWMSTQVSTEGPHIEATPAQAALKPSSSSHSSSKEKSSEAPISSDPMKGMDATPGATGNAGNNFATSANGFGTAPGASAGAYGAAPLSMPGVQVAQTAPGLGVPGVQPMPAQSMMGVGTLFQGGSVHPDQFHEHFKNYFSGGKTEKVPAMVSPGEVYLSPEQVHKVVHEGANPMKIGEKIRGKAKVKGDSLKNDIVPKTLEEGGVVIPRHIAAHKMSAEKAELFVRRAHAKHKAGK